MSPQRNQVSYISPFQVLLQVHIGTVQRAGPRGRGGGGVGGDIMILKIKFNFLRQGIFLKKKMN